MLESTYSVCTVRSCTHKQSNHNNNNTCENQNQFMAILLFVVCVRHTSNHISSTLIFHQLARLFHHRVDTCITVCSENCQMSANFKLRRYHRICYSSFIVYFSASGKSSPINITSKVHLLFLEWNA